MGPIGKGVGIGKGVIGITMPMQLKQLDVVQRDRLKRVLLTALHGAVLP